MPRMPIQDEPESTIGRKPAELAGSQSEAAPPGATTRREEGDETEAGSTIRDRKGDDPAPVPGLAE